MTGRRSGKLRILLFVCGGITAAVMLCASTGLVLRPVAMSGGGLALIVAAAAYCLYVRTEQQRRQHLRFRDINRRSIARFDRCWDQIHTPKIRAEADRCSVQRDLDIVGEASLFQLTCTAETAAGRLRLEEWLIEAAAPSEVVERQEAVRELAPLLEWRQGLQFECTQLRRQQSKIDRLIAWSNVPQQIFPRRAFPLVFGSALLSLLLVLLTILQIGSPQWVFGSLLCLLAVHLAVTILWSGSFHGFVAEVSPTGAGPETASFSGPLSYLCAVDFCSPRMKKLQRSAQQAQGTLKKLEWLLFLANLRRNPATTLMVYLPLQLLFLWDLLILHRLEAWRRNQGVHVPSWFDMLGETEALSSLASLAGDQPDWCLPMIDPDADRIEAAELGHPLLANSQRVTNDVTIGPHGQVLLVTGSNMSGKSTLLRAIGVNVMLAQAGGPVCAAALRMPPLVVATSMRISDSLASGESLFMAEVLQLKEIIDTGRRIEQASQGVMLYLLDEILHGTNSAERHIAVLRVLGHLLKGKAIGAISTHDLELARAPELIEHSQIVHLREAIHDGPDGPEMSFDYLLRPGCAPTTNALRLVAMLGLDEA